MQNAKLVWKTVSKKVNELVPFKGSPRKLSDSQLESLKKSLDMFNLVEIPAVDLDNTLLAGNQRMKVLQLLGRGEEMIDVRVPNRKLSKEEAEWYMLSSNAIHADWDYSLLKEFDMNLLLDLGFDQKTLDDIWDRKLGEEFDPEKELAKIKKATTKTGDVIELGPHRLICGDSTKPETLQKLFGDERASMIFSDPIYNISVDYNGGIGGKQNYGGDVNDSKTDTEYKEFLKRSMESALAVTKKDAHIFYWSDQIYIWLIQTLYRELGIDNKRVCLWLKNSQNPTPGVAFNKCYEPCTYGVRGKPYIVKGVNKLNEVMNLDMTTGNNLLEEAQDYLDIWMVKRLPGNKYEHSTMKPPEVYEKAIRRCTKMNDIILDSFSGSGSTIIAGEKLKRRVYAVELEPRFCDLAMKRYEKITGIKAKVIRHDEEV